MHFNTVYSNSLFIANKGSFRTRFCFPQMLEEAVNYCRGLVLSKDSARDLLLEEKKKRSHFIAAFWGRGEKGVMSRVTLQY